MRDWLTIQCEKATDSRLREFIQANPVLDNIMRTLLTNYLNLSETNLKKWIQEYQHVAGECSKSYTNDSGVTVISCPL